MAIICFANSGPGIGGRAAAAVAEELLNEGLSVALYDCLDRFTLESPPQSPGEVPMRNAVCGRQFIEQARGLKRSHELLVIDLSDAGDQIAALAFAMADLILVPFVPHDADSDRFVRTIELLDILSSHRSQPLRHAVFLAGQDSISPRLHLEISGQLIRRGLTTLPVPFQERRPCLDGLGGLQTAPGNEGESAMVQSDISRFAHCALDATLHFFQSVKPGALASG